VGNLHGKLLVEGVDEVQHEARVELSVHAGREEATADESRVLEVTGIEKLEDVNDDLEWEG
jgi:hypothetical protein